MIKRIGAKINLKSVRQAAGIPSGYHLISIRFAENQTELILDFEETGSSIPGSGLAELLLRKQFEITATHIQQIRQALPADKRSLLAPLAGKHSIQEIVNKCKGESYAYQNIESGNV